MDKAETGYKIMQKEYEDFRNSMISLPSEDVFNEAFRINATTSLMQCLRDKKTNSSTVMRILELFAKKEMSLSLLYDEFLGMDSVSIDDYNNTIKFFDIILDVENF